jgi:uncharacterized protein YkwD
MGPFELRAGVLLFVAAYFGLAECGSLVPSVNILGSAPGAAAERQPEGALTVTASVALARILGAPKSVTDRMVRKLDAASRREDLVLLNYVEAQGDYRLQGDLKADLQRNKIRLSYRWLVFDKTGAEQGRIAGAEMVPGTAADPWGEITDTALQAIAERGIAVVLRVAKAAPPGLSAPVSSAQGAPGGAEENASVALKPAVQPALSDQEMVSGASQALRLVNDYRRSKGLLPLTYDNSLARAAAALADDMAKKNHVSHIGPNGADLTKRLKTAGYSFGLAAENIGAGQSSLVELIDSWKNDPSWSRNLLVPDAKQMGLGYKYKPDTKYRTYWTLVIAAP